MTPSDITARFTFYAPKNGQTQKYITIRERAKELAILMNAKCAPCRELTIAIERIEEAVMWCNAGIARTTIEGAD